MVGLGEVITKAKIAFSLAVLWARIAVVVVWDSILCLPARVAWESIVRPYVAVTVGLVPKLPAAWRIEQVTAKWLTQVLRAKNMYGSAYAVPPAIVREVISLRVFRIGAKNRVTEVSTKIISGPAAIVAGVPGGGGGAACNTYRATFKTDDTASSGVPSSFVIKFTATSTAGRFTSLLTGLCSEVQFYESFSGLVRHDMRTPICYFARADWFSGDYVLVLEDLAPLTIYGQGKECTDPQLDQIVMSLARLHARFIGTTKTDPALVALAAGRMAMDETPETSTRAAMLALTQSNGWKALQEFKFDWAAKWQTGEMKAIGDACYGDARGGVRTELSQHWARNCAPYTTLTHNDFHFMNILMAPPPAAAGADAKSDESKFDATAMAVVDWQVCGVGVGPVELGQLMMNCKTERRRALESKVWKLYETTLRANITDPVRKAAIDPAILYLQYRATAVSKMIPMVCLIIGAVNMQATEAGQKMLQYFSDNVYNFAVDNKSYDAALELVGRKPAK